MSTTRRPGRFRAHAEGLGIPGEVSGYLLDAIAGRTPVPDMLRRAALIDTGQNLNPYGLAAQVRKLLSWDYRKRPGDYTTDPKKVPIPTFPEDGAGRRTDGSPGAPGTARRRRGRRAGRRGAAGPYKCGFVRPGHGTSYDRCGRYVIRGCLGHADGNGRISKCVRWRCGRLPCPVCHKHSIALGAGRATMRLIMGAILCMSLLGAGRRRLVYLHYAVSVDPSHYDRLETPEGVYRYRREVIRQMKWLGFVGGAVVYHPWKFRGGRWHYRPHFHVLAAGYVDRDRYLHRYGRRIMLGEMDSHPIREVNRRTGDVYAKMSQAGSYSEVYSILVYMLRKAGLRVPGRAPGRERAAGPAGADGRETGAGGSRPGTGRRNYGHAIVYFGNVATCKFSSKIVLSRSRHAWRDIHNIVLQWQKRADELGLSAWASIQPVTCRPDRGTGGSGGPRGSVSDADPWTAEYGAVMNMPVAEAEGCLRRLAARGDNAPLAKSAGEGGPSYGPAPGPCRYVVVKLAYHEKCGGVRVRYFTVIALDPSMKSLCRECRRPLKVIVRADGGGIPPPDADHPERVQCAYDDAGDWTYHQPRGEHASMGMPYYEEDGSPRWDAGIPNMPADVLRMPAEYRRCLREECDDRIVRYATAAMRRQNPRVNPGAAERAVRRHLARAGHPDKTRDGWEEDLLADIWREYADMTGTGPPGRGAPGGGGSRD